jgi:hypothetical protein
MPKKEKFRVVKHVKRISRALLRPAPGRPIQSKKQKAMEKILEQESQEIREEF